MSPVGPRNDVGDLLAECLGLRLDRPSPASDACAVVDGSVRLTHGELLRRVRERSAELRLGGAGPGVLLPLHDGRTADTVVEALAVLAAGAAFVPVPPGGSPSPAAARLAGDAEAWPPHVERTPGSTPAYVMTTSGSTGQPKDTVVSREGLRTVFGGMYRRLRGVVPPALRWTQLHPLTFGFAMCEVLGCLAFAGELVIVGREEPLTLEALARELGSHGGGHMVCLTPSELSLYLQRSATAKECPLPSHVFLSGEPAHRAPLRALFSRAGAGRVTVVNSYAATETSGQVTVDVVTPASVDAVLDGYAGRPLPGVDVTLRTADGGTVPPDDTATAGEIEVRGASVASGYLDSATTRNRFFQEGGAPSFRTGDMGRWGPGGDLVVLGRGDRQVKLAGRWVSLDRIERTLVDDGLVLEAAAATAELRVPDGGAHGYLLVAAVPTGGGMTAAALRVRRHIVAQLSGPATVHVALLDAIPRTRHGKLDIRHLTAEDAAPPPDGAVTTVIRRVWEGLLGAGVPLDANLFEAGVDSLGVVAASARLSDALGRTITPAFLLDHPRIDLQIDALTTTRTRVPAPRATPAARGAATAVARRRAARAARHDSSASEKGDLI